LDLICLPIYLTCTYHLENFLVKKSKSSCFNITKGHNTPGHLTKGVRPISFQGLLIVSIQILIYWVL
jgi:hypothetical protein